MNKYKSRRLRNRTGATTVELAVILPVFLLVLFGCMEYTRVSMMRNLSSNACYAAARASIVTGATDDSAKQIVDSVLARLGVDNAETNVTFLDRNGEETDFDDSQRVRVAVSIPYGVNRLVLSEYGNFAIRSEITLWTSRN